MIFLSWAMTASQYIFGPIGAVSGICGNYNWRPRKNSGYFKAQNISLLREAQNRNADDDGATSSYNPHDDTTWGRNQIDANHRRLFVRLFVAIIIISTVIGGIAMLLL
jgi:hypothetical protein